MGIVDFLPDSTAALLGILVVAGLLAFLMTRDAFWRTDMAHRVPLIGKLARYSHDYSETKPGGWLNVELALCRDYARHLPCLSKQQFENDREYLRKAFDHGRKPMPPWVLIALLVLIMAEALGFSYVLSGLMALEASANLQYYLTWVIVAVLATILVWVTHKAGHQLYRTRLLRSCFRQYQAQVISDPDAAPVANPSKRVYSTQVVSLADAQHEIDRDDPTHVQCANRVMTQPGDRGSYVWVWIAAILVTVVAISSIVLRAETLAAMAADDAATAAEQTAAMTGFFLLATIFVVTQVVSIGVGFAYGFGGRQSKEAFDETRGCTDYEAYFRPVRARMNIAALRLTLLHRKMEQCLPQGINWKNDFHTFIQQERDRGITDLQDPTDLDNARGRGIPKAAPPNLGLVDTMQRPVEDRPA